jgi:hypothetical protein
MASFQGIPSPFPAQPFARSPKLRLYESLLLWNQGVDQLVATLRRLEKMPFANKRALQCTQAEIEELRAGVNADFVEELGERERRDQGRFWKQRRAYEKTMEDPDDVYFEVEEREEQRRKEGLPARLGIVPHSAPAEEQKRIETERQRKRQPSKERPRPSAKAKNTMRAKSRA